MSTSPSPPRFAAGDQIVVRDLEVDGHVRTPGYVRGRCGVVCADLGVWGNPERLAYGLADPRGVRLYRIELALADVWEDADPDLDDQLVLDVYEHWLDQPEGAA